MLSQVKEEEFNSYYSTYISKAEHADIAEGLGVERKEFVTFVESIPEEKWSYAYAENKWTIAEVLQHIIDTERIFAYRALRFARQDKTPLAGFEQDDYVPNSNANQYSKHELISDFIGARNNSIALFKSFTDDMLLHIGEASGSPMSARAAGYILQGHQKHHLQVIKERYL
ncbi:DinB family protein [Aquimarina mytili]|uniref:DinB family protein n=1 Tax=Aquimarina mytili TaxID=874423 RepID=A0A936ZVR7_9FLAO|nr:DinB family protein [Aquimarina mytili]MBL0683106.1 DinB family protein [Aquimarina mytili]